MMKYACTRKVKAMNKDKSSRLGSGDLWMSVPGIRGVKISGLVLSNMRDDLLTADDNEKLETHENHDVDEWH